LKFQTLCVLGLGYIGLPTASTFATHGLKVTGVDTKLEIVAGLNNGEVHLFEPGLRTLVQSALQSGNLEVKDKPQPSDAFIIAVPTPFKENKQADLDFVKAASESIVPVLTKGNLVILESTSPPRTTVDVIAPILERSGLKAGADFHLAYSPERVLPGQILRELIENARVIGGIDHPSAEAGRDLYSTFVRGEIVLTDATTAEMVKLMENTFRDINIAAANEFARLADQFQVDIWEAIALANRHPRVKILNPGPGVGGHCISVDPWFLVEAAPETAQLIRAARMVNDSQPDYVLEFIEKKTSGVADKRVTVLGLAYKPDVDDLRESPAVEIARLLIETGAKTTLYDPFDTHFTLEGARSVESLNEAIADAEILLLLVGHTQFKEMDPIKIRGQSKAVIVIDAVNGWERSAWQSAGFAFHRIGDGKH
jgi:UDP-N-acetyl-D-mannosaminuronic acid dehydrogenase